jgi:hypothetical protein
MNYTLVYRGGLGDIFFQMYWRGSYNVLRDLHSNDTATVHLITHNPHTRELFDYHEKASQIEVHDWGWRWGEKEMVLYTELGISPFATSMLPIKDSRLFFTYPEKNLVAELSTKQYVVISASAGDKDRTFPIELLNNIIEHFMKKTDLYLIAVGKTFVRNDRIEVQYPDNPRIINMIDKLSVPATATILQNSRGLITAHSAFNIMGWIERIPQLLLYTQGVFDRHFQVKQRTQWSFGINYPETIHGRFDEYSEALMDNFIKNL